MIRIHCYLSVLAPLVLVGCGQGVDTSNPGAPPPHGGVLIKMPSNQGFVEVVKKDVGAKKDPVSGEVTFYMLKDMTTPFDPAPSSATLTVGKQKISLKCEGEGLITPTGPPLFPKGELDGVLTVVLDGKSRSIPLGVR